MTEWRTLDWLPDYKISERGRIERAAPSTGGRPLKGTITQKGYLRIRLIDRDGNAAQHYVHKLVCEAFHGPRPPDKDQVAHWDGNGLNNHYTNLRWATAKENGEDTRRLGSKAGDRSPNRKLSEAQVATIKAEYASGGVTHLQLAIRFGVARPTVSNLLRGYNWKCVEAAR